MEKVNKFFQQKDVLEETFAYVISEMDIEFILVELVLSVIKLEFLHLFLRSFSFLATIKSIT
jgi:hypothetical protein